MVSGSVAGRDQLDEPAAVVVFEIEESAERPVERLGQVRDLCEQVFGRVRQDSPGAPPAMSTVNSLSQDGHVTAAWVWRWVLTRR
jgi:hypothetical protein